MRAIVLTDYGPPEVLQLKEVPTPEPKANEVLIRIHATTVTAGDTEMRQLKFPLWLKIPIRLWLGFRRPKENTILGTELAGVVAAAGPEVQDFKVGDRVFGTAGMGLGANAEYICLAESDPLVHIPDEISFEEAAGVPFGAQDALHFLRVSNIRRGQKVCIVGAGGSIGTFAVQLARHYGAEVTGVDSTAKLEMVRSLGAEHVIDYTREDFTKNGQTYDVIFDTVGKSPFGRSLRSLNENGVYLLANPRLAHMLRGLWTTKTSNKTVYFATASANAEDLLFLRELMEAGALKAVIDRSYPLEQIVEAHRYVETGQKLGNLVITIDHGE
jgi:NADPH:quinone reductase-like Zn-dependent oxidoreductase